MAYLDDPNQQNQTSAQAQNQNNAQAGQTSNAAANIAGSGGSDVGSVASAGTGAAGVGPGGSGGWTNIQSYLDANQGDTGSAQNLTNQASGQFAKEQNQMQNQANQAMSDSQGSLNKTNISNDQANQMIQSAANGYNYGGQQSQDYQNYVKQMQDALNGQYTGPTSFSYALSNDVQKYGDQLGNDQGFQNLMTKLYSDKAGTPLTSGQSALQGQLDVNNQALAQARQNLLGQYSGLQSQADQLNQNVSNTLANNQNQFIKNQNNLQSYLSGQAANYDSQISQAEQNAKSAYQNAYTQGQAPVESLWDYAADGLGTNGRGSQRDLAAGMYTGQDNGQAGFNWQDIQNLLNSPTNFRDTSNGDMISTDGGTQSGDILGQVRGREAQWRPLANNALQNFYTQQDQQYGNTADAQKRDWNAIQDFLGTNAQRQTQGFKVRG